MSTRDARILVVEDNDTLRRGIVLALCETWSDVEDLATGDVAVERISDARVDPYDVILTDLRLPGVDGIAVLAAARERDPRTSVLVMTAYGSIETAVGAMRRGAYDFVQKPLDLDQLELRVQRPELVDSVDAAWLSRYERILQHRGDFAVVGIERGVCMGCHMQLPPQLVHDARKQDTLTTCSFCGRILFVGTP